MAAPTDKNILWSFLGKCLLKKVWLRGGDTLARLSCSLVHHYSPITWTSGFSASNPPCLTLRLSVEISTQRKETTRINFGRNAKRHTTTLAYESLLDDLLIRRISFVNNGWRELKETPSSNWKIPCQAVMFCVSEKRPSSN
ncbi:hypothetical protein T09_426 [Trichinella sp. T9]|nr:hypothetical protein T09_426 [Trichinella sp. T9]